MRLNKLSISAALLVSVALLAGTGPVAAQNGPYDWADDAFTCYKAKQNKVMPKFPKGTQATMTDRFGSSAQDIKKRRALCLPAERDSASAADAGTLLTGLKIKTGKGEMKHIPQSNLRVFNDLGDIRVDTKKEALLLTPTAFGAVGPAFGDHAVDNFKCYKAKVTKGTPKFPKGVRTNLGDTLEDERNFDIKGPKLLCTSSSQNGDAIKNNNAALLCYKIKAVKGEPKATPQTMIETADGFGLTRMDTKKESLACFPSLISPPDEFCGDGTKNQDSEECDGSGDTCFGGNGMCDATCSCTTCGNGQIDAGEVCDVGVGCDFAVETCDGCGVCNALPSLGQRDLSLSASSGFFTSFIPGNAIAQPSGTLSLEAGIKSPTTGIAPVSLSGTGPQIVTIPIVLGGVTLCYEYQSCSGSLYCDGGQNVDMLIELDSLATGAQCVRDGTANCANDSGNVCCSNSCEGVGVGSGNSEAITIPSGASDSGAGALVMTCTLRVSQEDMGADCSQANFDDDQVQQQVLTTGSTTVQITNHCAGNPNASNNAATVPEFTKSGENFVCADWNAEDSAGSLSWGIATEQPSGLLVGDGSQVATYND